VPTDADWADPKFREGYLAALATARACRARPDSELAVPDKVFEVRLGIDFVVNGLDAEAGLHGLFGTEAKVVG
jgi:hypothetical protein